MIYLYTENFILFPRLKSALKSWLGRGYRGPQGVFMSLTGGLKGLGRDFLVDQKISVPIEIACVLSGVKTVQWAILQKQKRKIKKIIAGPNIVVSPNDCGGLIKNPALDTILVPSQWVKDFYCQIDGGLANRIKIWAAGVSVPEEANQQKFLDFIVYNKLGAESPMISAICKILTKNNLSFKVLTYGKFRQRDYFELLEKAKYEIYLSKSESQGLAMFEAWARNVPTLVWEKGTYANQGVEITGQISAPFLSPEAGLSFGGVEDFEKQLKSFVGTGFFPREYVSKNFTNKISAQKYLNIIYGK